MNRSQQQPMFKFGFDLEILFIKSKEIQNKFLINIFEGAVTKKRFKL